MRTLALLVLLVAACDDGGGPPAPDMALKILQAGEECTNGIGGVLGACAVGLECCTVACTRGDDGGCLDLPSECTAPPVPSGRFCY